MRKCEQSCEVACPVLKFIKGEETDKLSWHDGAAVEDIAHTTQNAAAQIRESCDIGAPGKPLISFGRLACNSRIVREYFAHSINSDYAIEQAVNRPGSPI